MRRRRLARGAAVALVVVPGIVLFVLSLPPWARASATTTAGAVRVSVSGTDAAPGVAAAALLVVAAGLVLALSGRLSRVLGLLGVLAGGLLGGFAALGFLRDPRAALEQAAAEATGVDVLDAAPDLTAVPVLAALVSLLLVLLALALPLLLGRWGAVGRRYERDRPAAGPTSASPRRRAMDDWDSLSRGDDPSDGGDASPGRQA